MSSFSAYLTVGSFRTWINSAVLHIQQQIDTLGRPASLTHGGKLTLSFNATADSLVTDWMFDPAKVWDGSITYVDDLGVTLKVLSFTGAFCIGLEEDFDGQPNAANMVTTITISPEKITIGGVLHDNDWPNTETQ